MDSSTRKIDWKRARWSTDFEHVVHGRTARRHTLLVNETARARATFDRVTTIYHRWGMMRWSELKGDGKGNLFFYGWDQLKLIEAWSVPLQMQAGSGRERRRLERARDEVFFLASSFLNPTGPVGVTRLTETSTTVLFLSLPPPAPRRRRLYLGESLSLSLFLSRNVWNAKCIGRRATCCCGEGSACWQCHFIVAWNNLFFSVFLTLLLLYVRARAYLLYLFGLFPPTPRV